jgi:DNA polymerase III delta prime subunit
MTPDAQSALRRIIEAYSKVTRFCLVCNYVTRVIEPLASRCAKFRFRPLPVDSMKNRMREIAGCEGIQLTEATLEAILQASNGDMRKAVTFLQSAHQLSGGLSSISPEVVIDISGKVSSGAVCTRSCECKTTRFLYSCSGASSGFGEVVEIDGEQHIRRAARNCDRHHVRGLRAGGYSFSAP